MSADDGQAVPDVESSNRSGRPSSHEYPVMYYNSVSDQVAHWLPVDLLDSAPGDTDLQDRVQGS